MSAFRFVGLARPQSERVDVGSAVRETFRTSGGESVVADRPAVKAALLCLHEAAPRALTFDELCAATRARLELEAVKASESVSEDSLRNLVTDLLRQCIMPRVVALYVHPAQYALNPGDRPVVALLPFDLLAPHHQRRQYFVAVFQLRHAASPFVQKRAERQEGRG